jgi:hypothetical protein
MTVSAEDRAVMGTPEAAKEALFAKVREYRECRQPRMAPAAEHRRIEKREHQVRFELAEAAMLFLWHEENPAEAKPRVTVEQVRGMLRRECRAADSQRAWADLHNVSEAYVSDVLLGRRDPGEAICKALGLRRVEMYEAA